MLLIPKETDITYYVLNFFGKANYDKIYLALKKLAEKISHVFKKIQSKKAAVNRMETKMARHQSVSPCFFIVYIRYGAGYHKDDY